MLRTRFADRLGKSAQRFRGQRETLPLRDSKGSGEAATGKSGLRLTPPVSFQHAILGVGFAILATISAVSIALDVKSRSDAAWVRHTLEVLNKIADTRLSIRRAESEELSYSLTKDKYFMDAYRLALGRIAPAIAELKEGVKDNSGQIKMLENTEPIIARRFALTGGVIGLSAAGDSEGAAALAATAGRRTLVQTIDDRFELIAREEQRLLQARTEASERTGSLLLAIDMSCSALILLLAAILMRKELLSRRRQKNHQQAVESANGMLEAAVAERTAHLLVAHEELRHSTSVINGTFASMAEAVLVVDRAEKIVLANLAAERLLHYRPGMTVAQLWAQYPTCRFGASAQLPSGGTPTARVLLGEQLDGLQIVLHRSGEHFPIEFMVSARSLREASGAIYGGALVFHDVTLARETERRLRQSQKLDAIGKLTGGVAHDFNNMLTVIGGTIEGLVERLHDRPGLQSEAVLIGQAADRCTELIKHLLAFARGKSLEPRSVDVNTTVTDIGKLLKPTLGEQIEVEAILEQGIASALVDPSQLANALINLAINARDAMPDGGKLTLETAEVVLDKAYAQSHADVRAGTYVMVTVTDTGFGMSAELCERVFEPFFTTKEVGKGTGLGLSMVYGFAKQSEGYVDIHSEPGRGTTIRLYLPVASGKPGEDVPSTLPGLGAGEIILVVEDDALVRDFVIAQLHSLRYRTVAVADGQAALAYLESGGQFDLLFTDVVMPGGMTGRQLADEFIKIRPSTKVLYTSGYTEDAIMDEGRIERGVMLLAKPYRKSGLASMIRLALDSAAVENHEVTPIPLSASSIVVPTQRLTAVGQARSSG